MTLTVHLFWGLLLEITNSDLVFITISCLRSENKSNGLGLSIVLYVAPTNTSNWLWLYYSLRANLIDSGIFTC